MRELLGRCMNEGGSKLITIFLVVLAFFSVFGYLERGHARWWRSFIPLILPNRFPQSSLFATFRFIHRRHSCHAWSLLACFALSPHVWLPYCEVKASSQMRHKWGAVARFSNVKSTKITTKATSYAGDMCWLHSPSSTLA